jgi:hypothetical protein
LRLVLRLVLCLVLRLVLRFRFFVLRLRLPPVNERLLILFAALFFLFEIGRSPTFPISLLNLLFKLYLLPLFKFDGLVPPILLWLPLPCRFAMLRCLNKEPL